MTTKLLIPVDGSDDALRAVEYVVHHFGPHPDLKIILLHILPELPPSMWDDGHILDPGERRDRRELIDDWEKDQEKPWVPVLARARDKLVQGGVSPAALTIKYQPRYNDISDDILDAAEAEGCSTIVLGRHGTAGHRHFFLGGVSQKVVNHARGLAVIIVDFVSPEEAAPRKSLRTRDTGGQPGVLERLIRFSKYW